jgi:AraC-like DNA-binding protein
VLADRPRPTAVTGTDALHVQRYEMRRGQRFGTHSHVTAQLTVAALGMIKAEVGTSTWLLPPSLALWIPGSVPHDVVASRSARFHSLYVVPWQCPIRWTEPVVVTATPLLRELVSHLLEPDVPDEEREHAQTLLFDVLHPVHRRALVLPWPRDPRLLAIADAIAADPTDDRTLTAWGREVGASSRTLARLFAVETGYTFSGWRTQARLRASLDLIADGVPVSLVANRVGYRTASGFVASFRRALGQTPGAYAAHATLVCDRSKEAGPLAGLQPAQ